MRSISWAVGSKLWDSEPGDQQADRSLLAGYFPGKVKGGKHSGDYAERAAAALITAALTAAERQDKGQYQ